MNSPKRLLNFFINQILFIKGVKIDENIIIWISLEILKKEFDKKNFILLNQLLLIKCHSFKILELRFKFVRVVLGAHYKKINYFSDIPDKTF